MKLKRWLPIALCCLPGVIIGVLLGVAASFFGNARINNVNPNSIFLLVMGLACPIGMGLMMWLMNRSMSNQSRQTSLDTQEPVSAAQRLAALQQQRHILEAEIAELTEIVALEVQQGVMLVDPVSVLEATPIAQE